MIRAYREGRGVRVARIKRRISWYVSDVRISSLRRTWNPIPLSNDICASGYFLGRHDRGHEAIGFKMIGKLAQAHGNARLLLISE